MNNVKDRQTYNRYRYGYGYAYSHGGRASSKRYSQQARRRLLAPVESPDKHEDSGKA